MVYDRLILHRDISGLKFIDFRGVSHKGFEHTCGLLLSIFPGEEDLKSGRFKHYVGEPQPFLVIFKGLGDYEQLFSKVAEICKHNWSYRAIDNDDLPLIHEFSFADEDEAVMLKMTT